MRALIVTAALLAPLLGGCEDAPPVGADLSPPSDLTSVLTDLSTSPTDQAAVIELEDFVVDLIVNRTNETSDTVTTEDKTFVDSMDPAKLAVLF